MAHAHNRTLLQSLGFSDKDRGGDHDLICTYLCDRKEDLLERFFPVPPEEILKGVYPDTHGDLEYLVDGVHKYSAENRARTEWMITKGSGQYRTTIGFLDVIMKRIISIGTQGTITPAGARLKKHREKRVQNYPPKAVEARSLEGCIKLPKGRLVVNDVLVIHADGSEKIRDRINYEWVLSADILAIEVKNTPTPVSEVVKQINVYREYMTPDPYAYPKPEISWLLVTAYQISASDKTVLDMAGIKHMRIGEKFQAWKLKNAEQVNSEEF